MPRALPIPANPAVIAWARRESGFEPARVAKRLGVSQERLLAWERGVGQPTARQLERLAQLLRRPFSIFFLPRPPEIPPLAAERRRLPGVEPGRESPELRLALRTMIARRETALDLARELGDPVADFPLDASLGEDPAAVGRRLRTSLGLDIATQFAWADEWRAWAAWRTAAEGKGILVFLFPGVAIEEARGLALLRRPLPVAAVNSKEIPEARIYTLLHETVHLMLAAGHQEVAALQERRPAREWRRIERFAEIAASHAAVPEAPLRMLAQQYVSSGWDVTAIRQIARRFRITPLATATRLRESGLMPAAAYRNWRRAWDAYVATLPPRRGGFASPADKALNRAGRPFVQLVLDALSANRITSVDAARHLDLGFGHFEALRASLVESAPVRSAGA